MDEDEDVEEGGEGVDEVEEGGEEGEETKRVFCKLRLITLHFSACLFDS